MCIRDRFELVAAVAYFDAQALADLQQVLVELATEAGQTPGINGFYGEAVNVQ